MKTIATDIKNHVDARNIIEEQAEWVELMDPRGTGWEVRYNDEAGNYDSQYLCYREGRGWGRTLAEIEYPVTIQTIAFDEYAN